MRLKFIRNIFVIILCLNAIACGTKYQVSNNAELNEAEGVSMAIEDGTLNNQGATIVIKDVNSPGVHIYGEEFYIQEKIKGEWSNVKTIHDDYSFNDLGYIVDKDGQLELECNWSYIYGNLDKGEYRLVKYTFRNDYIPINKEDYLYFSVEFTIK